MATYQRGQVVSSAPPSQQVATFNAAGTSYSSTGQQIANPTAVARSSASGYQQGAFGMPIYDSSAHQVPQQVQWAYTQGLLQTKVLYKKISK